MHAVIGRVKIKPDRADEALSMIGEGGVAMLRGMAGSAGGYWARSLEGDIIQHSFWVFDTEDNARAAEATFNQLRDMPMRRRRSSAWTSVRSSGRPRTGVESAAAPRISYCGGGGTGSLPGRQRWPRP